MRNALSKLQLLRELDSIVDFARGYVQLKVMMTLSSGEPLSAKDIGLAVSEKRKTVIDALRKLVDKGLVMKEESSGEVLYRLSELGREYLNKLNDVLERAHKDLSDDINSRSPLANTAHDIASNIAKYVYLMDALIAIATSRRRELSLIDVADAMKLSPDRAQSYIEMYAEKNSNAKLFTRIERRSKSLELLAKVLRRLGLTVRINLSVYRITDDGLTVFYKLPYYIKYKRGIIVKVIAKIFGSAHPRLVLKKAMLYLGLVTIATGLLSIITSSTIMLSLAISLFIATGMLYVGYKTI